MKLDSLYLPVGLSALIASEESFFSQESLQQALSYQPDTSDIFIVTPPKSGTTWVQQITHGLRSHGDIDFEEIFQVIPWFEMAYDLGINIAESQKAFPRIFKTHLPLSILPKGARYITVIRNPIDTILSYYHFCNGFTFAKNSVSLLEFAGYYYLSEEKIYGDIWEHIKCFDINRNNKNILALTYENMIDDLPRTIEIIAEFMHITLTPELKKLIIHQSSHDFMLSHKEKFDEHIVLKSVEVKTGFSNGTRMNKVSNRKYEQQITIPDTIAKEIDKTWQRVITPVLGFSSYASLCQENKSIY